MTDKDAPSLNQRIPQTTLVAVEEFLSIRIYIALLGLLYVFLGQSKMFELNLLSSSVIHIELCKLVPIVLVYSICARLIFQAKLMRRNESALGILNTITLSLDALVTTKLVESTGGVLSPATALYLAIIFMSGRLFKQRGAYIFSLFCAVMYLVAVISSIPWTQATTSSIAATYLEVVSARTLVQGVIISIALFSFGLLSYQFARLYREKAEQLAALQFELIEHNRDLDAQNLRLSTMQAQLIHQEKMASLGRMVAGIAHELNNPINFVHGNIPYLRKYCHNLQEIIEASNQVSTEERKPIEELKRQYKYDFLISDLDNILLDIQDGSERIKQIIKNLRSFSRLDEAQRKEGSIQDGIVSTLKILNQYYGSDRIPVELELEDLPAIMCYPGQLNQVWMNLLSNAAEAIGNHSDPLVKIKAYKDEDEITVEIADNGSGINENDKNKIFDPFFTTKPVGQGTGLGLSICHSIIERHQGSISFSSSSPKGTTFIVKIPLHPRPDYDDKPATFKDDDNAA